MNASRGSLAIILGVIAAGAASLRAQAVPAAEPVPLAPPAAAAAVTAGATYVSTYLFRGLYLGGQSAQPSLELDYGGLALGVWESSPVDRANRVPGQSDPEIDPYGSYLFDLGKGIGIQPGFTWYTYPKAPLDQGFYRMTFEPNVALSATVAGVKLTPKVYDDTVLRTATGELNAGYALPLKSIGSELDLSGTAGTYHGTRVLNTGDRAGAAATSSWGNYWLLGASLPFTLSTHLKLVAGWAYTRGAAAYLRIGAGAKAANPAAAGRGVASLGLSWTF